jgi:hypothetical protein
VLSCHSRQTYQDHGNVDSEPYYYKSAWIKEERSAKVTRDGARAAGLAREGGEWKPSKCAAACSIPLSLKRVQLLHGLRPNWLVGKHAESRANEMMIQEMATKEKRKMVHDLEERLQEPFLHL